MYDNHLTFMIIATYAKAAGLSRDEATIFWHGLQTRKIPTTVDQAYEALDEVLQRVRKHRSDEEW
jgi:hypothetical protein